MSDSECFVLVPVGDVLATACFSDEFTEAWQWAMEDDHIIPQSQGGTDEPENHHLAHFGCQRRQGGRIGGRRRVELHGCNSPATSEGRRKGGFRRFELHGSPGTQEGASRGGSRSMELHGRPGTSDDFRKGAHVAWHVNRGVSNSNCSFCLREAT